MNKLQQRIDAVQLLEGSGVLVAIYDEDDRLRFANQAFREAWFIAEDEQPLWQDLMRRNFSHRRGTVIKSLDFEAWLSSTISRRGKSGFRAFETDLHDGRWLWITETSQVDGWMICIASDITSIGADERSLRQDRDEAIKVSLTDELTGIPGRRYVMTKLSELLDGAEKDASPAACIAVLDIDNFKYINDRFGHATGDAVLRDFTTILLKHVRKTDIIGRVGGEEFVLILPRTSIEDAEAVVGRMLDAIRISRPLQDQISFRYTFSAGIARAETNETTNDVYRRADLALYAAKMRGRDQVALDPSSKNHSNDVGPLNCCVGRNEN